MIKLHSFASKIYFLCLMQSIFFYDYSLAITRDEDTSVYATACFEKSDRIYKVEPYVHLSDVLHKLDLTPLWCRKCSVAATMLINNLENPDQLRPGMLIVLPKKCGDQKTGEAEPQTGVSLDKEVPIDFSDKALDSKDKVAGFTTVNNVKPDLTGDISVEPKPVIENKSVDSKPTELNKSPKNLVQEETKANTVTQKDAESSDTPQAPQTPKENISNDDEVTDLTSSKNSVQGENTGPIVTKKTVRYFAQNKIWAEPYFVFNQLVGEGNGLRVSLNSDVGLGSNFYYQKNYKKNIDYFLGSKLFLINMSESISDLSINNSLQFSFGILGGFKYFVSPKLSLSAQLQFRRDLFVRPPISTTASVDVITGYNTILDLITEYNLWNYESYFVNPDFSISYFLPTKSASLSIDSGFGLGLGMKIGKKLNWGRVYMDGHYFRRDQKIEGNAFYEQVLFFSMGYVYLY